MRLLRESGLGIRSMISYSWGDVHVKAFLRAVWDTIKVFVLFVCCTALFYYAMMWVEKEYENYHKYDKPKGSVEVYQEYGEDPGFDWLKRLQIFYKIGE